LTTAQREDLDQRLDGSKAGPDHLTSDDMVRFTWQRLPAERSSISGTP
jgi:hypothetical protein